MILGAFLRLKDARRQRIKNEAALLLVPHQARMTQDGKMVGDVHNGRFHFVGNFGDILWAVAKEANDLQAFRRGQGA